MKSKIQGHNNGSTSEGRIVEGKGSAAEPKDEATSTLGEISEAEAEAKEKRETGRTWDISDWMRIS